MALDVFDIRKLPELCSWYTDPVDCEYHYDPDGKEIKIYVERNIPCDAQWLYCFKLCLQKGIYFIEVHSEHGIDVEVCGVDMPNAKNRFIEKIIDETMLGQDWERRHPDLVVKHQCEKVALREKIGEFLKEKIPLA